MNNLEYWTLVNGDMQQAVYRMDEAYMQAVGGREESGREVALRVSASAGPPPVSP